MSSISPVELHARRCDRRLAGEDHTAADQLQIDCGEGPWRSRESGRRASWAFDTAEDPRWPKWGPRVAELGLRSLLSIQLRTHRSDVGLLNFYSAAPGRFAEAGHASADLLSRHAAIAIDTAREAVTLRRAIETRTVIGKAQGILMERCGLNADQAFAVLLRCSQDTNTKLYEVATSFIETRQLPTR